MVLITDALCVKLIAFDKLLVAVGNELRYYYIDNKGIKHLNVLDIRLKDKIHGINYKNDPDTEGYKIIIYGGRELVSIKLSKNNSLEYFSKIKLTDWISNINLYALDLNELCCLTSHSVALNILLSWNKDQNNKIIKKITCSDKSTLYCSLIHGEEWESSIYFGGTALGELIIWKHETAENTSMLYRLSSHNGVIFSINFNADFGIISTTSDDRSLKIWKMYPVSSKKRTIEWKNYYITPIKTLFGHTARVFQSKMFIEDNQLYIASVGEDSKVSLWKLNGDLIFRKIICKGTTLWNLDYDSLTKSLIVCSSDGNVHRIKDIFENRHSFKNQVLNPSILESTEYIAKFKIIYSCDIIAITNLNRIMVYNIQNTKWKIIEKHVLYKISIIENHNDLIAIAGYQRVSVYKYCYKVNSLELSFDTTVMECKIRSLKFLSNTEFLICDNNGNCLIIFFESNNKIKFVMPKCKENLVTSALKWSNFILIGDRSGNLYLYEITLDTVYNITLCFTLKKIHWSGCTCIHLDTKKFLELDNYSYFLTTGRDGTIKRIELNEKLKSLSLYTTKKTPILWIEKILIATNHNSGNIIVGFNDSHLIVAAENQLLFKTECGGGHRCWDIYTHDTNKCSFLYIRKKIINIITFSLGEVLTNFPLSIPHTNWHTQNCNVLLCCQFEKDYVALISGGDDNCLKMNKLNLQDMSSIDSQSTIISHISNIRAISLKTIELNKNYLLISAGGRAQICVTEINKCDMKQLSNYMLNSTDVQRRKLRKSQYVDLDPETRFMCLVVLENFVMFIGCSDGYLRQFSYKKNQITSENFSFYGKCILNICQVQWKNETLLLTMATDGLVCFWRITNFNKYSKPSYCLKHHESGINSFDTIKHSTSEYFVASGGDDQTVVISLVHISDNFKFSLKLNKKIVDLHTAQVTGVKFMSSSSIIQLFTTSIDQTIYSIKILKINGNFEFFVEHFARSCISDIKGMVICNQSKMFVYGWGLESFNISSF